MCFYHRLEKIETRKTTRFDVVASEKDLALAKATSIVSIELRFRWRKLVKARIKIFAAAAADDKLW